MNRIRLHRGEDLLLELRNGPERATLLLSLEPGAVRLSFVPRPKGTGEEPGGFLQLLRARIEGLRIGEIDQVEGDRIVCLRFGGKAGGPRPPAELVAELMGARASLYLLDDEGRVEGSLHGSRFRTGDFWSPPAGGGDAPAAPREFEGEGSYSQRIESHYALERQRRAEEEKRAQAIGALKRERTRLKKLEKNLKKDVARAGDPDELRIKGQLLKANARSVPPESKEISLPRWDRPEESVTIELKPSENAGVNADRYFDRARRAQRTMESAQQRMDEASERASEIETLLELAGEMSGDGLLAETKRLQISLEQRGGHKEKSRKSAATSAMDKLFEKLGIKPRRYTSRSGRLILVGRSSKENDTLTTKVARPYDYFFHVSGAPGSHVIACVNKGGSLDRQTLWKAAELALRYSGLAKSRRGEVSYCERRYVRKRKGDPPGLVHFMGPRETLWVELTD